MFFVAIAAASFFSLSAKEFFGFLVIFMMAGFAFFFVYLHVTSMKRLVKTHGQTGGCKLLLFPVAVVTFNRAGFFSFQPHFSMTGDTAVMIYIHDLFSACVL